MGSTDSIKTTARLLLAVCAMGAPASCIFIDNPGPAAPGSTSSGGDGAATDAGADADAPPSICDQRGGFAWADGAAGHLVNRLLADCRVSAFFIPLPLDKRQHFTDCLAKQLAVVTRCQDIKYDVDAIGVDCRDMKAAHKGLNIHADDVSAFIDDVSTSLAADGLSAGEAASIGKALSFFKGDIVANSAPGSAKSACDAGDGG